MFGIVTSLHIALLQTLRDRKGVSAVEYTLMVVGIGAAVLAGAQLLGGDIKSALTSIGGFLSTEGGKI